MKKKGEKINNTNIDKKSYITELDEKIKKNRIENIKHEPYNNKALEYEPIKNKLDSGEDLTKEEEDYIFREEFTNYTFNQVSFEVMEKMATNRKDAAIELIAKYMYYNYNIKSIREETTTEIWIYKDGIYVPNGSTYIEEITYEILDKAYTPHIRTNLIAKIVAKTYIDKDTFFNQQNKFPYLIPVKNGILDIKNNELKEFTPNIYFFNKLNCVYNPEADCSYFKKFVSDIVKNPEEDLKVIQEMFGFSLLKDYKYEKAFMLYGKSGRNGKSKLLEVLTVLLGIENTADINLQSLEDDDFELSNLHNKLVNISADLSDGALRGTGMFKNLTGRDTIQAKRKFKTSVQFKNYAKMIFATNQLPPTDFSISDAFWQRWVVISFPNQFLPEKEIKAFGKNKPDNVRLQDQTIIEKLTTDDELQGILNWAIEGLHRLEKQKDFSNTQTANGIKHEWLRLSNSVSAFIMDNINTVYEGKIKKEFFKKKYLEYCRINNLKRGSDKQIKITLENEMSAYETRLGVSYDRTRCWVGIDFIKESDKIESKNELLKHDIHIADNYMNEEETQNDAFGESFI